MDTLKLVVDYHYMEGNSSPSGRSDNGGRWYPDDGEKCDCCDKVRSPSRSYPWSLWKHCKSKKHIKNWVLKQTDPTYKEALNMTKETAPLYLDTKDPMFIYVRDHLLGYHLDSRPVTKKPITSGVAVLVTA